MSVISNRPLNIVCLATYFKGVDFIRECKELGCNVVLITKEKMLREDWPRESLDDLIAVPNDAGPALFIDLLAFLARDRPTDRVIALEEFDVVTAALMREHLCLPGLSSSHAKIFRDKLSMAVYSQRAGINVPEFVQLLNHDEVNEYMQSIPGPWVIKPRSDVSAIGIKKVAQPDEVWRAIEDMNGRENLRERASYYVLARFIPGEVFHVDSLVNDGKVVFAGTNQYGRPPMQVAHQGGAYISRTVARGSADEKALFQVTKRLIKALGLERCATHAEFIKSDADGEFYFLEIAARVGGAHIADVLEAASGINLWREWARLEVADAKARPRLKPRKDHGGIILSLARQESPDTSNYTDPEIVYRVKKKHHAGLIVGAKTHERVSELLDDYGRRFVEDFIAVLPPLEEGDAVVKAGEGVMDGPQPVGTVCGGCCLERHYAPRRVRTPHRQACVERDHGNRKVVARPIRGMHESAPTLCPRLLCQHPANASWLVRSVAGVSGVTLMETTIVDPTPVPAGPGTSECMADQPTLACSVRTTRHDSPAVLSRLGRLGSGLQTPVPRRRLIHRGWNVIASSASPKHLTGHGGHGLHALLETRASAPPSMEGGAPSGG